jgi:hypothetical protein
MPEFSKRGIVHELSMLLLRAITRNMTKSCWGPRGWRTLDERGRISTAGGVQGKDCVRRMCTTEGYVTVKNCVTLHVLSSSLPDKG